jgi:hypothetical protein
MFKPTTFPLIHLHYSRTAQILQKSYQKPQNSRCQTGNMKQVHADDPQLLGTTEQNFVTMLT